MVSTMGNLALATGAYYHDDSLAKHLPELTPASLADKSVRRKVLGTAMYNALLVAHHEMETLPPPYARED